MKKVFSKASNAAIFFSVIAILCFFAPFLKLEGTNNQLNVRYITGFELITNVNIWGPNFHESLEQFQMSVTSIITLVFLVCASFFNLLTKKAKVLGLVSTLLLIAGAVMTFAVSAWGRCGFAISPSSWNIYVHVGSMVSASFMVISAILSLAGAASKN